MGKRYYDTVIFGATFLGLAAACASGGKVAVIEKGGLLGAEFTNSYKVCRPGIAKMKTGRGEDFLDGLKKRGLVSSDGEIYPAPAVYVLSARLQDNMQKKEEGEFDILLMTEVISVKKADDAYEIRLFHSDGFETIKAKQILDTTNTGTGHGEGQAYPMKKQLNAIVYNPGKASMEGLSYNTQNQFYTYSLPVERSEERWEAVERLCAEPVKTLFAEKGIQLSSIASDFSYTMEKVKKPVGERFEWIPSTAYDNLAEAFDAGICWAEEETV